MKGDPSMRYEYSSGRAAAGNTSSKIPHSSERSPTSRRHYKAASEITGNLIQLHSLIYNVKCKRSIIFCHISLFYGHVNGFIMNFLIWGWIDRVQARFC